MNFRGNFCQKLGEQSSLFCIFRSRLCQLPYCKRVLETSRRWGQVGEQHAVIYDIKSPVVIIYYSVIELLFFICYFF